MPFKGGQALLLIAILRMWAQPELRDLPIFQDKLEISFYHEISSI